MNDLTKPDASLPDFEGEWTEEDISHARLHFMRRAEERYAQEDGFSSLPDYEDEWTEEDMRDLTAYSMKIAEERYPHEDGEDVTIDCNQENRTAFGS